MENPVHLCEPPHPMYSTVLIVHSWLRYPVLLAGVLLLGLAIACRDGGPSVRLEPLHRAFMAVLNTQLMFGLLLYCGLSPLVPAALADMGSAMAKPQLRFFAVEHIATMLLAGVVAHVGRARARRAAVGLRARIILRAQALWLLLTLAAIPWPGLDIARPLFRLE